MVVRAIPGKIRMEYGSKYQPGNLYRGRTPGHGTMVRTAKIARVLTLWLPLIFTGNFLVFFCRFLYIFQVKVRIVHKRLLAGGIIGFDFLSFVDKGDRVISERLSVHDTIVQRIRLYFASWVSSKCG